MAQNEEKDVMQLWSQVLEQIKNILPEDEFSRWFERVRPESAEKGKLVVCVSSAFIKDSFEKKYRALVEKTVSELENSPYTLLVKIKKTDSPDSVKVQKPAPVSPSAPKQEKAQNTTLNPAYTFETFVPGENSNFAYSAAMAIAKNPGSVYNPCLLYGGVGLGKTHLLQSIGNYVHKNTNLKVLYVTAENFTNEYIQALNEKNPRSFQNKYRKASLLLIDDIQFLQKKEGIQQELFSTFNDLYDTGRQIVFTCDRPVEELRDITERLRSRFERGLNIDIQPPNYETRLAILQTKCKERNFIMSSNVLEFIASNISTNVRALEACITKLMAYSELLHQDISLETARQQLKQIISSNNDTTGISMDVIIKNVASYYNLSPFDIKGKNKNQSIVIPRQIAMYLCRKLTDFSTTEIASEFGGKNHTTVMYNVKKVESLLNSSSSDLSSTVEKIENQIKAESKH